MIELVSLLISNQLFVTSHHPKHYLLRLNNIREIRFRAFEEEITQGEKNRD